MPEPGKTTTSIGRVSSITSLRLIKRAYGSKIQFAVSHSRSFVHPLRPPPLRTAIAIARR
jgi:hypothetical protein